MDKIYSRKRIKIFYSDSKKIKKKVTFTLVIAVATATIISSIKSIDPIFENLCKEKAMTIATKILNTESTKVVHKYEYKDIVQITKNENDGTNILKTDVTVINDIASDIAVEVTNRLQEIKDEKIEIPVGALFGNKYLSGMGPGMDISIIPAGDVTTELKTEFKAQGINQTVYRIYLEVICNVNIITSYKTIDTQIINQVLLVETVIVGDTPQTYYNLEGVNTNTALEIIE
ncbi:MAG: sporulation protein YunB [Clostridia bacterium]